MNYNKQNCQTKIRSTVLNNKHYLINVVGQHAFEWSIAVTNKVSGDIKLFNYANRRECLKHVSLIKKQYSVC